MSGYLDIDTWVRREHFHLFRQAAQPFFGATILTDVTQLVEDSRRPGGRAFLISALYHALTAANGVPALRLRMRLDRVRVHDSVRMSTTVMRDNGAYNYAVLEPRESLAEFYDMAQAELARAKAATDLTIPEGDGIIYHSTIPWLRFTGFSTAVRGVAESVPRVIFGQRYEEGGRFKMPLSVEVHHAVADGIDIGKFVSLLQAGFDSGSRAVA